MVKQHYLNYCGQQSDFAPFYLAKTKLFSGDNLMVEECLKKARILSPNDWRVALALIRFNLDNKKADEARVISKDFLKKYPEKGEMGMCYAQSLIQLKKHKEALAFLESFNVLPYEGATIGRIVYHEACVRAAMDALAVKNYSEVIRYAEKAKLWPTNLGVGQPFDLDERMDIFMIAFAKEKQGKVADAEKYYSLIAEYKHPQGSEENTKLLLQLLALQKIGKSQEATCLLSGLVKKYPASQYLKWVDPKFNSSADAPIIEQEIFRTSGMVQPYDVVFVDKEFKLMRDFVGCIK